MQLPTNTLDAPPPPESEPALEPAPRHPDDIRLEGEFAAKIAAHVADWEAQVASLRRDREPVISATVRQNGRNPAWGKRGFSTRTL